MIHVDRHILLCRRNPDDGASFVRVDYVGDNWRIAASSGLAGLFASAIGAAATCDFTMTGRSLDELIPRGDPAHLDVPRGSNAHAHIFLPIGDEDPLADNAKITHAVFSANGPTRHLLSKVGLVRRPGLVAHLKHLITLSDLRERGRLSDRRELWVRHGWSARDLFPDQFRPAEVVDLADHRETAESHESHEPPAPAPPAPKRGRPRKAAAKAAGSKGGKS